MARYIKANSKVAEYLKLENDRNKVTDGNYLLWQADMLAFGRLTELPQILEQIGGLALQAHEAREEQDGTVVRKLPVATDPRFIVEVEEPAEQPGDAGTVTDTPETGADADTETDNSTGEEPAQEPEAPEEPQGDVQQPVTEEPEEATDQPSEETEAGQEEADTGAGGAPSNDDNAEQTTNEETEA